MGVLPTSDPPINRSTDQPINRSIPTMSVGIEVNPYHGRTISIRAGLVRFNPPPGEAISFQGKISGQVGEPPLGVPWRTPNLNFIHM